MYIHLLISLLIVHTFATNDNCAYYDPRHPLNHCMYANVLDNYGTMLRESFGYFCDENDSSIVSWQYWNNNSECEGDPFLSNTFDCEEDGVVYCNCEGSIYDCTILTITRHECGTDDWWRNSMVVDLCYATYGGSTKLDCAGDDAYLTKTYTDSNCTEGENIIPISNYTCDNGPYWWDYECGLQTTTTTSEPTTTSETTTSETTTPETTAPETTAPETTMECFIGSTCKNINDCCPNNIDEQVHGIRCRPRRKNNKSKSKSKSKSKNKRKKQHKTKEKVCCIDKGFSCSMHNECCPDKKGKESICSNGICQKKEKNKYSYSESNDNALVSDKQIEESPTSETSQTVNTNTLYAVFGILIAFILLVFILFCIWIKSIVRGSSKTKIKTENQSKNDDELELVTQT